MSRERETSIIQTTSGPQMRISDPELGIWIIYHIPTTDGRQKAFVQCLMLRSILQKPGMMCDPVMFISGVN